MAKNYKVVFDEVKVLPGNSIKLLSEFGEIGAAKKDGDEVKLTPYNCWDLTKLRAGDMTAEVETPVANEYYENSVNHLSLSQGDIVFPMINYERGDIYLNPADWASASDANSAKGQFLQKLANNTVGKLIVKNTDELPYYINSIDSRNWNYKEKNLRFETENPKVVSMSNSSGSNYTSPAVMYTKTSKLTVSDSLRNIYACDVDEIEVPKGASGNIICSDISNFTGEGNVTWFNESGKEKVLDGLDTDCGFTFSGKFNLKNCRLRLPSYSITTPADNCNLKIGSSDSGVTLQSSITNSHIVFNSRSVTFNNATNLEDTSISWDPSLGASSLIFDKNENAVGLTSIKSLTAVSGSGSLAGIKKFVVKSISGTEELINSIDEDATGVTLSKNKSLPAERFKCIEEFFVKSSPIDADFSPDKVEVRVNIDDIKQKFSDDITEAIEILGGYSISVGSVSYYPTETSYSSSLTMSIVNNELIIPLSNVGSTNLLRDTDFISIFVNHKIGDTVVYTDTLRINPNVKESARIRVEEDTPADAE